MIDAYHVYITGSKLMFRRQSGLFWRRKTSDLGDLDWDIRNPSSLVFDQIKHGKRWSTLSVYLGSALCKFMAFELPPGVKELNEKKSVAKAQMQRQLGLISEEWVFTLESADMPNKSIGCAIRRDIYDKLTAVAKEKKWRLISIQPFVCNVWNAFRERQPKTPQSALLTIESDAFTVIAASSNFIDSISSLAYNGDNKTIEREIKRLSLSLGNDGEERIYLAQVARANPFKTIQKGNVLSKKNYLGTSLYSDFRDLLFSDEN